MPPVTMEMRERRSDRLLKACGSSEAVPPLLPGSIIRPNGRVWLEMLGGRFLAPEAPPRGTRAVVRSHRSLGLQQEDLMYSRKWRIEAGRRWR